MAPHLAHFTSRTTIELHGMAARMPVPDLSGQAYEHALTVQMTALTALLQQCDAMGDGGPEEAAAA